MNYLMGIVYIIIAPMVGGLMAGIDRKITARMQGRVGPPLLQPFYDVYKLTRKQTAIVNKAEQYFVIFFLVFMIFTGTLFFWGGDILLVVFAFTLTSIFLVMAAYSTNSPFSSIGADRELLQMMSYEPMVILMAVGMYQCKGSFAVSDLVSGSFPAIIYLPGIFIGFIFILAIKLRKSPFDISTSHHGHQELVKGITTEFAGKTLAMVEVAHWYESVLIYGLVYIFFAWDSPFSMLIALGCTVGIFLIELLIDNVSARVKWQLVIKGSWIICGILGFLNIIVLSIIHLY